MSAYPTADVGSSVTFTTFTVAEDLDGDHCNGNTPTLYYNKPVPMVMR